MEGQKARNIIRIIAGQEHRILDNQDITDQESLMYPAFSAALDALAGIVKYSDTWNQRYNGENRTSDGFYGYSNNILAFCAPRGQGKTSAMLSFSRAIECGVSQQEKDKKLEEICRNHYFYALPPIDPTMLREGESVIQLVLGKLFNEISKLWEKPPQRGELRDTAAWQEVEKFRILEEFKACYRGLFRINKQNGSEKDIDDFEEMLTASDIFQLKERLHNIIQYFFRLSGHASRESFLLIQLDDTDMQMEHAYSILEEVRQYLAIPNVVVLMATYLDQLRTLITQQFAVQLHKSSQIEEHFAVTTRRMAAKYLDKLIPASQTVYLPTMRVQRDTEQILMLVIEKEGGEVTKPKDLENEIFSLIYEKTGLAFIRHDSYMHSLLPTTLRGLQHLYRLLNQMENLEKPKTIDFDNGEQRKAQLQEYGDGIRAYLLKKYRNLLLFESYFLNDWCSSKVAAEDWNLLKEIDSTASIRRVPYAVQRLNKRHGPDKGETNYSPVVIWSLSAKEKHKVPKVLNQIESIKPEESKGFQRSEDGDETVFVQLIGLLSEEARRCVTEEDYLFVFAVETYFSIQLNKLAIVDQIGSMDALLKQIKDDKFTESPFLYDFSQLVRHLCGDSASLQKIPLAQLKRKFETLMDTLKIKQENDNSKEILEIFLQLFSLEGPISQMPNNDKRAISLQEYAVYICCNLDVLAQVLKKTADWKPPAEKLDKKPDENPNEKPNENPKEKLNEKPDKKPLEVYFDYLKKAIVQDKETCAYPFSASSPESFYKILDILTQSEKDLQDAAKTADEETKKDNT